jgi:hypothetical protein
MAGEGTMMIHDNPDPTAYLRALSTEAEAQFDARLERIKARYVESDRDEQVAGHLKRLIRNAAARRDPSLPHSGDNRRDGRALILVGEAGAGKSTLLQRAFLNNPAFPNYGRGGWCPLISVTAPAPCTLLQLAMRILIKLGWDSTRELRENAAWLRVRIQLKEQQILFLHIEDFQHVVHLSNLEEVQKVRDTLKDLMSSLDWPVQVILSGIPELVPFAKKDPQLRRRVKFIGLSQLSLQDDSEFLADTVKDYAKGSGLKLEVNTDELVGRLMHASQYQMGLSIEIVIEAIEAAFERQSKSLTLEDFANAYAARSLMPDEQNPFVANAWDTIDTSLVRPKMLDPDEGDADEGAKTRRKRRKKS